MAKIISLNKISEDVFDMALSAPELKNPPRPGQFINVYLNDESRLLPRPISICDYENGILRIVFRAVGAGTLKLSEMHAGDTLKIMGPLGNGFYDVPENRAILFGGGIGIPPMLYLSKKLSESGKNVTILLGYRNSDTFLKDEFEKYGRVFISTDDGSVGFHGNTVELFDSIYNNNDSSVCLYACGPLPMLRGIKATAAKMNLKAQISMEERMACGIGACLACVCKSAEKDVHSNVFNKRVCKDGPVFFAEEIEI